MAIFFKISYDGKSIDVVKTLISNKVDAFEFTKKAKKVSAEDFLEDFPKEIKDVVENKINRVCEIQNMKLGMFGVVVNSGLYSNEVYYHVGDDVFVDYNEGDIKVREEAVKYGIKYFGKEFMEQNIEMLDRQDMRYYSKTNQISKEEYSRLNKELSNLTSIMNVKDIKNQIEQKKSRR